MKKIVFISLLFCGFAAQAQNKPGGKETPVPCDGNADMLPGKYTDHTNPKYPTSLKGNTSDKAAMLKQLIAIEKLEEASRKNFNLTGCVARVSFSGGDKSAAGIMKYGYQLGVYRNVCHVTQHIVKTVDEYSTVFRVNINNDPVSGSLSPLAMGIGSFNIAKYPNSVQYDIPVDAIQGKSTNNNPSRVSKYISEGMLLTGRSDNYRDYHADFLKLNNGNGYVENWQGGDRYANHGPSSYQFIDRHYLITKPGIPLLIPVSRKQYLEDMLEYLEIEKANFYYDNDKQTKQVQGNNAEYAKKRLSILEADKVAYPQLYEAKKAKIKQLLAEQKDAWLQQQAIVGNPGKVYDANDRLKELGKFYDKEGDYSVALYVTNPEYFKSGINQSTKPQIIEVQFRYEIANDRGYSERLFNNFLKNFDMEALRKMLQ